MTDGFDNLLTQAAAGGTRLPARYSRAALVSFGCAVATMLGVLSAPLFFPAAFLHLLFPVAIICGHIGLRRVSKEPAKFKGRNAALFGLYIGYFNLLITATAIWALFG